MPYPPNSVEEVEILPGVPEALGLLVERGIPLIGVTNQPDVARGKQSKQAVDAINAYVSRHLPLTALYTCFHDNSDNCNCRKPRPGLLIEAAAAYNIDLSKSFMVGDRWSDVVAGQAAGCRALLIDLPYSRADQCNPDFRVRDLPEAVRIILGELGDL